MTTSKSADISIRMDPRRPSPEEPPFIIVLTLTPAHAELLRRYLQLSDMGVRDPYLDETIYQPLREELERIGFVPEYPGDAALAGDV